MARMRHDRFALVILALGLEAGTASSSRCFAGARIASSPAPPGTVRVIDEPRGLGSAANPIPFTATEARAPRRVPPSQRDRIEIRFAGVSVSLYGTSGVMASWGGGIAGIDGASRAAESNVRWGGGIQATIGGPAGLALEGGRVTLRDPIDVLAASDLKSEYWTTSAGLAIQF